MEAWSISQSSNSASGRESSTTTLQPLAPPIRWNGVEIDSEKVQEIESTLRKFEPLLKPRSKRRAFLGLILEYSGSTLTSSGGISTNNIGPASTAFARVSAHLDVILQNVEPMPSDSLRFTPYLENLQEIPIHVFDDRELKEDLRMQHDWDLIHCAATASHNVYEDATEIDNGQVYKAKGSRKAMIAYIDEAADKKILIIAVRGTVTPGDWMLNVNSAPKTSSKVLPKDALWHGGFLTVALAMSKQTATAIQSIKNQHDDITAVMFTGHSAGGAIAHLFYVMSLTEGTKLSQAVSNFAEVNCITFGTPPISSIPLHTSLTSNKQPGLFLHIVNEGDPVPLAQEEFIRMLVEVYVLTPKDLSERYPGGVKVPQGHFRASGNLIILRDVDPDDGDGDEIRAFNTDTGLLETKLFGNPFVHPMDKYVEHIEKIELNKIYE